MMSITPEAGGLFRVVCLFFNQTGFRGCSRGCHLRAVPRVRHGRLDASIASRSAERLGRHRSSSDCSGSNLQLQRAGVVAELVDGGLVMKAVEYADVIGEREVSQLVTTSFDGERARWSGGRHLVDANAKFDARGFDP